MSGFAEFIVDIGEELRREHPDVTSNEACLADLEARICLVADIEEIDSPQVGRALRAVAGYLRTSHDLA